MSSEQKLHLRNSSVVPRTNRRSFFLCRLFCLSSICPPLWFLLGLIIIALAFHTSARTLSSLPLLSSIWFTFQPVRIPLDVYVCIYECWRLTVARFIRQLIELSLWWHTLYSDRCDCFERWAYGWSRAQRWLAVGSRLPIEMNNGRDGQAVTQVQVCRSHPPSTIELDRRLLVLSPA